MNKKHDQNKDEMSPDELRKLLGLENDPEYADDFSSSEISKIMNELDSDELQDAWDDFDDLMLSVPKYLRYLRDQINQCSKYASLKLNFDKNNNEEYVESDAFSNQSIQEIERFFLDVYNSNVPFEGDIDELILAVGLFLGEAAVERLEGEWLIWDKQGEVDYGKPVVAFWQDDDYGLTLNPFEMVVVLMEDKIDNTLLGSLNAIEQASIRE